MPDQLWAAALLELGHRHYADAARLLETVQERGPAEEAAAEVCRALAHAAASAERIWEAIGPAIGQLQLQVPEVGSAVALLQMLRTGDRCSMPAARVTLRCFGSFTVVADGRSIPLCPSKKAVSVLKYLAVSRQHAESSDHLVDTFWPNSGSLHSLQVAVYQLRQCLPDSGALLSYTGSGYRLSPEALADLDLDRFRAAYQAGRVALSRGAGRAASEHFEEALTIGAGELLPDDLYEDWLQPVRAELSQAKLAMLAVLGREYARVGEWERSAECCRRVLKQDPAREDAHRQLMRLHARQGRNDLVARQYRECCRLLEREYGVQPSEETRRLYARLMSG